MSLNNPSINCNVNLTNTYNLPHKVPSLGEYATSQITKNIFSNEENTYSLFLHWKVSKKITLINELQIYIIEKNLPKVYFTFEKSDNGKKIEFPLRIFCPYKLSQYIKTLNEEELQKTFYLSSIKGFFSLIKTIICHSCFNKIIANGPYSLAHSLIAASKNGHSDIVKAILNSSRFHEIDANGGYGLGNALLIAIINGHFDIAKAFINNSRFFEMPVNEVFGLTHALISAAENGHFDIAKALINSGRFFEIHANNLLGLNHALIVAAENGHFDIAKALINSSRFHEITNNTLDTVLKSADENDHKDIAQLILEKTKNSQENSFRNKRLH